MLLHLCYVINALLSQRHEFAGILRKRRSKRRRVVWTAFLPNLLHLHKSLGRRGEIDGISQMESRKAFFMSSLFHLHIAHISNDCPRLGQVSKACLLQSHVKADADSLQICLSLFKLKIALCHLPIIKDAACYLFDGSSAQISSSWLFNIGRRQKFQNGTVWRPHQLWIAGMPPQGLSMMPPQAAGTRPLGQQEGPADGTLPPAPPLPWNPHPAKIVGTKRQAGYELSSEEVAIKNLHQFWPRRPHMLCLRSFGGNEMPFTLFLHVFKTPFCFLGQTGFNV